MCSLYISASHRCRGRADLPKASGLPDSDRGQIRITPVGQCAEHRVESGGAKKGWNLAIRAPYLVSLEVKIAVFPVDTRYTAICTSSLHKKIRFKSIACFWCESLAQAARPQMRAACASRPDAGVSARQARKGLPRRPSPSASEFAPRVPWYF
jgi:hypothetical protein